jgi:hypothetical protein
VCAPPREGVPRGTGVDPQEGGEGGPGSGVAGRLGELVGAARLAAARRGQLTLEIREVGVQGGQQAAEGAQRRSPSPRLEARQHRPGDPGGLGQPCLAQPPAEPEATQGHAQGGEEGGRFRGGGAGGHVALR